MFKKPQVVQTEFEEGSGSSAKESHVPVKGLVLFPRTVGSH